MHLLALPKQPTYTAMHARQDGSSLSVMRHLWAIQGLPSTMPHGLDFSFSFLICKTRCPSLPCQRLQSWIAWRGPQHTPQSRRAPPASQTLPSPGCAAHTAQQTLPGLHQRPQLCCCTEQCTACVVKFGEDMDQCCEYVLPAYDLLQPVSRLMRMLHSIGQAQLEHVPRVVTCTVISAGLYASKQHIRALCTAAPYLHLLHRTPAFSLIDVCFTHKHIILSCGHCFNS